MATPHIYLVGFMGAGKSTVGRELSLKLGWPFFDLDTEVEKSEGLPVREIFSRFGEPHFRELERRHLRRLSEGPAAVVALGGGAYIDPESRASADSTGVSVWLDVSFANVMARVQPDGSRPLFADPGRARQLFDERLSCYRLARIHVRADNRLPGEIVEQIMTEMEKL